MPIFEYKCLDCDGVLELLQFDPEQVPKRCGFRCLLGPDDNKDCRGMGDLKRLISRVNTSSGHFGDKKP